MIFPTLYKKTKSDAIQSWKVWTENENIFTEHGKLEGKKQRSVKKAGPKNIGKRNEISAEDI